MSAICLCGVCIPYSAILPLLLVLFQYLCKPLYRMGLLPDVLAKKLGLTCGSNPSTTCCNDSDTKTTDTTTTTTATARSESSSISSTTHDTHNDHDVSSSSSSHTCSSSAIVQIASQQQLNQLLQQKQNVILKFTAEWCKPCKTIQPLYEKLAAAASATSSCQSNSHHHVVFGMVDVDEADDVASEFKVAMMPTFVAIRNGKVVETMSGANESKLESFVQKVLVA
jgi:Thioredoxin domain-containing protein